MMGVASNCTGWNPLVIDGCGTIGHPFDSWKKFVDEKKYDAHLNEFMQQYDIGPFEKSNNYRLSQDIFVIKFFTAKYGMFTCFDAKKKWGSTMVPIDTGTIERWEHPKQLKRTWNLCFMSACATGQGAWEDLA